MNSLPFVSVVMPVYNGEVWLREASESILKQSYRNFELIIVDDGSTDSTPIILEELAVSDDRVYPLTKPNSGIAESLNHGVKHARGQWICRIDADDIAESNRIETQVKFAQAATNVVLIGSDMISIDDEGLPIKRYHYPTKHEQLLKNLLEGGKFFPHSSAFFRKDAFIGVGGYRPRISRAEDHDLWLRLAQVGKISSIAQPLVRYRLHDSQISYLDMGLQQAQDKIVALLSYHLRELGRPDPVSQTAEEFDNFKAWLEVEFVRHRSKDTYLLSARLSDAKKSSDTIGLARIIAGEFLCDPRLFVTLVLKRFGFGKFIKEAARKWTKELG